MNKLIALAVVAGGVGYAMSKGCMSADAPDEQFASSLKDVCKIARAHKDTPNDGVTELGNYLADHAGDTYKHLVDTVAMLVQIKDDDKHTKRVDLAHERWNKVVNDCVEDFMDFADAIENDETASRRVGEFQQRLDRTLDELFNGVATGKLRDLPLRLQHYLTTTFQAAPSVPSPVPPAGAM